jgi:hypothetical protein
MNLERCLVSGDNEWNTTGMGYTDWKVIHTDSIEGVIRSWTFWSEDFHHIKWELSNMTGLLLPKELM